MPSNSNILLLIGLVGFFVIVAQIILAFHRTNLKDGDVVGVRYGDYVLSRKIVKVLDGEIIVSSYDNKYLEFVRLDRVYLKTNE